MNYWKVGSKSGRECQREFKSRGGRLTCGEGEGNKELLEVGESKVREGVNWNAWGGRSQG